jgi:hypothetical protein
VEKRTFYSGVLLVTEEERCGKSEQLEDTVGKGTSSLDCVCGALPCVWPGLLEVLKCWRKDHKSGSSLDLSWGPGQETQGLNVGSATNLLWETSEWASGLLTCGICLARSHRSSSGH